MARPERRRPLIDLALASGKAYGRAIADETQRVELADLACATNVTVPLERLRGRSLLLLTGRQLPAVLAVLALDGIAARLFLGLPDLGAEDLPRVMAEGEVDVVMKDRDFSAALHPDSGAPHDRPIDTEWILFTSGTMGAPRMVAHNLASLISPIEDGLAAGPDVVWSTFYDVRRYGGLQILLRALLGGGSMVLSSPGESIAEFLVRAGKAGVTHMSGTPSHWRRALMSPMAERLAPRYVRLSGEIADQAILDNLRAAFPGAEIGHAFASTEAGLAFDVRDGLEGFPAEHVDRPGATPELRVVNGTLRVRSPRTATRYLGSGANLTDREGFVDTGDMVERRGARYYFLGRREGVINVGGQKVHPEEVEAVLNRHPGVRVSRVWGRPSPITGALVAADIVLRDPAGDFEALCENLRQACRAALPAHKVPVSLRAVPSLGTSSSGKLMRRDG